MHIQKTHHLHSTKCYENNAFCIFEKAIFSFDFGRPYVHLDDKTCPVVFKLIFMDVITIGVNNFKTMINFLGSWCP